MFFAVPFSIVGNGLWEKGSREMWFGRPWWLEGFRLENASECLRFVCVVFNQQKRWIG
jgi:hypothetical protein